MEIRRTQGPAQTGQLYLRRTDEPGAAAHLGEMAVEVLDGWSAAPRLAPAMLAGFSTAHGLGQAMAAVKTDPWLQVGVMVAGGVAAAAVGGYFGPTLAKKAESLGQKLAPKVGMDPELGGVLLRTGFKAGTLAATCAVAPGVGQWLLSGETFGVLNQAINATKRMQAQRQETLMQVSNGQIQAEAGQEFHVSDRGFQKIFQVTRLPGA